MEAKLHLKKKDGSEVALKKNLAHKITLNLKMERESLQLKIFDRKKRTENI